MLEKETIVRFIVSLKENRDISAQIRPIVHSILPMKGSRENRHPSTSGGRVKGNTIRTAAKIGRLKDELIRVGHWRLDKSIGEVVEVAKIDKGHEDINIVRPHGLLQVFSVERVEVRVWSMQEGLIHWQQKGTVQWNEVIPGRRSTQTALTAGVLLEDKLLRIIFFLRISDGRSSVRHRNSSRQDQTADRAVVVGGKAQRAEKGSRQSSATSSVTITITVHGGSGQGRDGRLRRGEGTELDWRGRGERRKLTPSFLVA
jgi:hypothetical protein